MGAGAMGRRAERGAESRAGGLGQVTPAVAELNQGVMFHKKTLGGEKERLVYQRLTRNR